MTKRIIYLKGDATFPSGAGTKIIAHICNDVGGWGRGFVLALSKRWKEPEAQYRLWYKNREDFSLGEISLVQVEPSIYVANMIAQRGIRPHSKVPPVRYDAVQKCLISLREKAQDLNASVHMPRIGCGLAGGKWEQIEQIINKTLLCGGIDVYIYDLE